MQMFRKSEKPFTQEQITAWLRELRGHPYVPDSKFDVTSVFRAKVGNDESYYFAGVNVENPHHRMSTHGEEGSISAMVTALGKQAEIVEGWLMGAPRHLKPGDNDPLADNPVGCCGKCRQQLAGVAAPEAVIHSVSLNGDIVSNKVGDLLPNAFTFREFAPELQKEASYRRVVPSPSAAEVENKLIRKGPLTEAQIFEWLNSLESVDFASKTSQSVVLELSNGSYVAGTKVEEAAFVSIDASQAALAIANAEFGKTEVKAVYSFSKGRDGTELDPESIAPLTLSGAAAIGQFASNTAIPLHLFNSKGESISVKLRDSARYITTFDEPVINGAGQQQQNTR